MYKMKEISTMKSLAHANWYSSTLYEIGAKIKNKMKDQDQTRSIQPWATNKKREFEICSFKVNWRYATEKYKLI